MKKIALIILTLFLIGCGKSGCISAVDYSYEISSSSVNAYSSVVSSSSEIAISSHDINTSSSSVDISSSSIISSSSLAVSSSSSSFKIFSSSSIQFISSSAESSSSSLEISSSSSSVEISSSSSSVEISSSSSSVEISSSSITSYTSSLFQFNVDSTKNFLFYLTNAGETSPIYEIVGNKIKGYLDYYGWLSYPIGTSYDGNFRITKSGTMASPDGVIDDIVSQYEESIFISPDNNMMQLYIKENGESTLLFKTSDETMVAGKRTFALYRASSNEYVCFWYNTTKSWWVAAGFSRDVDNNPFMTGVCSSLGAYNF